MENKLKKYIHIESYILLNDELFAMLDVIDNGGESYMDSILNDSGTESVSDKPISKIVDVTHDILVPKQMFTWH